MENAHIINMIVNLFALVIALFYTMNIPIITKLSVNRTGEVSATVGAFQSRTGVTLNTSAGKLIQGYIKIRKKKRNKKSIAFSQVKMIFRIMKIRRLDVEISMRDACETALTAGAIAGMCMALAPRVASVKPVFADGKVSLKVTCIISVKIGQAVIAAFNIAIGAVKERIKNGTKRSD